MSDACETANCSPGHHSYYRKKQMLNGGIPLRPELPTNRHELINFRTLS